MITREEIEGASREDAIKLLAEASSSLPLLIAKALSAPAPRESDRIIDAKEAAPRLNMHPQTLRQWTDCPFLIVRGRRKLYSLQGIERWIAEQTR